MLLLCSDGLSQYTTPSDIAVYIDQDPVEACQDLIDLALKRGGGDNITVQMVRARSIIN